MNRLKSLLTICILLFLIIACEKIIPSAPEENELLDGPIAELNNAERAQFLKGDIAFNDHVFTPKTGLGPTFVATSCGSCHAGDGKGHPFSTLTRFGQTLPNTAPNTLIGGPQLQNRAIPGYTKEQLPSMQPSMKLNPPAVSGLGYLAMVSDQDLSANADSLDLNNDGISGRINWVNPPSYFSPTMVHLEQNGQYIGRFGKKGATIDLLQQTVSAYNQDIGITSSYEPIDPFSGLPTGKEIDDKSINDVVFYLLTLKAPLPRNADSPKVKQGSQVFNQINCAACHLPSMQTGSSIISGLSNKTFYPYTDLLLHDMGNDLDDGVTEGSSETYEWKTPALWGLGLSPDSQGGQYFLMHDGRAHSIEEAILMHAGEGQKSKEDYTTLSPLDKEALITFLESL